MIQVIDRAFDILEFIASQNEKYVSLTNVCEGVNLHKATCSNIIKTMVKRNYLEKNKHHGYGLGFMFYTLTGDNNDMLPYTLKARTALRTLRDTLQEGCLLAVIRGKMRINIYKTNSSKELRIIIKDKKSAYSTASGRMLLASLSKSKIEKFIDDFGLPTKTEWTEITSKSSLLGALNKIHKEGYCVIESSEGILGYSIPIIGSNDHIFALSVFLPSVRWTKRTQKDIEKEVLNTASIIKTAFSEI